MLRNNLTLKSGVTLDRRRMLDLASKFAAEHPGLLARYLTHTFGIDDVQAAFELACRPGARTGENRHHRVGCGLTTSHLQQALARGKPVWGGWITGPTPIGPEEFARAGYDYVGFDAQHGYLDDADIATMLRRLEHVPIGTAVRLPSADPAPIGRVLDAGADAIIIAMIESADQAAAAVAATRYPPAGVRSFGPLRASLGNDTAALESRVSVFAMIETAAALADVERNMRRARAFRNLRRDPPIWRSRWASTSPRRPPIRRCATRSPTSSVPRPPPDWCTGIHAGARASRSRHGAAGFSDDHAGIGIPGVAARCRGRPAKRPRKATEGHAAATNDGPRATTVRSATCWPLRVGPRHRRHRSMRRSFHR